MGKKILPEERRLRIYNIVQRRGTATLGEMCAELGVSESTVRLDLNKMEQQGLIKRTHGGAVLSESAAVPMHSSFYLQDCIPPFPGAIRLQKSHYTHCDPSSLSDSNVLNTHLHTICD